MATNLSRDADTLRKACHNADEYESIIQYKRKVRELLSSDRRLYYRFKRQIEPKAVFGQIKEYPSFADSCSSHYLK